MSTSSRHEIEVYDGTLNVKVCVKLQKSPTGQMSVHGVEIREFSQAKEATDVEVQD
jgi:CTP-dependent riboflavin kinase